MPNVGQLGYSQEHLMSSYIKILRSQKYKVLGGVCSGIALSKGWSITLVRLIFLTFCLTGLGLFIYAVAWLILPKAPLSSEPMALPADPLVRPRNGRKIAGVCEGLGNFLKIDPDIVRVLFVVAVLSFGVGLIPYLYAWIAMPSIEN